jgi:cytochrome c biogenesis protein CcdA/thiol-disulfide isomerase/thioredoxin
MAPLLGFAFLAGVLTILSPCTLPVVPLVIGVTEARHSRRLAGILVGFGATFVLLTVVLAAALAASGLTSSGARLAAALVLALFGASLVVPALSSRVERAAVPLADLGQRLLPGASRDGFAGGLVLGSAIGLIWAPCVGPIMAGVIASAITSGPTAETALVAATYVLGAAGPLALVGLGGRTVLGRLGSARRRARANQTLGIVMVVSAALVLTGLDVPFEAGITNLVPAGVAFTLPAGGMQPDAVQEGPVSSTSAPSFGSKAAPAEGVAAPALPTPISATLPASVALDDLGAAPELTGIAAWINSPALTMASLRGKVVLVQFWTFDCINCIHVQPYVKAWYARYAAAGLVVIGVHTPELSFERDLGNVRAAVATDGVTFPVAFDPNYATWNAYGNEYWPAFYFIDKAGQIRHTHFGEGDYDGSEQVIRELLAAPG